MTALARTRERGYNLVTLIVAMTVMNILVAVAMPWWSQRIQREKEEEAIFRGLQYAEAIRVFQLRQGRYPNTLEELVKLEPPALRQLWDDPLSEHGYFGVVVQSPRADAPGAGGPGSAPPARGGPLQGAQGQELTGAGGLGSGRFGGGQQGTQNGFGQQGGSQLGLGENAPSSFGQGTTGTSTSLRPGLGQPQGVAGQELGGGTDLDGQTAPRQGGGNFLLLPRATKEGQVIKRQGLPIRGVYVDLDDEAIRLFNDESNYKDWVFTPELLPVPAASQRLVTRARADWVGKTLPAKFKPGQGRGPEERRSLLDRESGGLSSGSDRPTELGGASAPSARSRVRDRRAN